MAYVICSILAIFDKNDKKMTKNDIYDINGAYEICHMTVIYMLIQHFWKVFRNFSWLESKQLGITFN